MLKSGGTNYVISVKTKVHDITGVKKSSEYSSFSSLLPKTPLHIYPVSRIRSDICSSRGGEDRGERREKTTNLLTITYSLSW